MRTQHRILALFVITISAAYITVATTAFAQDQDSPSLGDLARQQRHKKALSKTTQAKDGKEPKVYTNADLPSHSDVAAEHSDDSRAQTSDAGRPGTPVPSPAAGQGNEQMRAQILEQKNEIAELQKQIDDVNESIRFAPGNCVRNCEQWNQHQQEKQQQVQQMQAQLDEQKKQLEEMQESARKQGLGSSVYDP
jgi:predicted RNase H-like nuclease (RuvC/YqgF family)